MNHTEKLELVHTYVCSSISTTSLNGNKYISFVDDFTRMI